MSKIQQNKQTHSQPAAQAQKHQNAQTSRFGPAHLLESPESLRPEDVLAAQQTVGNQVVQRALDKDDRRKGLTDNQGNLRQDLNEQIQQKRGGGSPLPENIQKEASKKLGRSFKDVRIHTDESADKLSRTISARAFTIGKDIFFKNGVFAPGSGAGRETIMHELTHVVQQGGKTGASGALKLGAPDTAHEKEADRIGKKHAASVGAAPAGAVQREGEEDELMMQSATEEEELLQMQGEEDELQMQSAPEEEELLQAQGEEDELQMQGEEDELQMQPDVSGVVQRHETGEPHTHDEDDSSKVKKPKPTLKRANTVSDLSALKSGSSKQDPPSSTKPLLKRANTVSDLSALKSGSSKQDPPSSTKPPLKRANAVSDLSALKSGSSKQGTPSSAKKSPNIGELPQGPSKDPKEGVDKLAAAFDPKGAAKEAKDAAKKAKAEEKDAAKKAKAEEKALDKRFALAAKDPKKFNEMEKQAKEKAEAKTQTDAESQEGSTKTKTESKGKKVGKAIGSGLLSGGKSVGSGLLSAGKSVGGYLKRRLSALDEHVWGKEEKKEDKDAKSSGGAGGTSEMIAELYQENKKLKAQITELEKAKV